MNYYQQHQSEFVEGLRAFLRIPSVSTLPEHKSDIPRAAQFVRNELRTAGMTKQKGYNLFNLCKYDQRRFQRNAEETH
jgi:acetylornithine deacetylase/succinyl-diaminopimelate desuccinylase-like protein